MIKEFYKKQLIGAIIIVILLLSVCISIDYADDNISKSVREVAENKSRLDVTEHKVERVDPVVTITAKPSCGCRYSYKWRTNTFINYCPHCHKYGTLRNIHKVQAKYEQELTCDPFLGGCGADYCGCCGKEKYSYSKYYITKA